MVTRTNPPKDGFPLPHFPEMNGSAFKTIYVRQYELEDCMYYTRLDRSAKPWL